MAKSLQDLKVYVINLDRRQDRWERVLSNLKQSGFRNIQRVSAVDGKLIDTKDLKNIVHPGVFPHLGAIRKRHEDLGSVGAVGCALSHYKVWSLIVESNTPAIIVEDDMLCHPYIQQSHLAQNAVSLSNFDFVLLAANIREPNLLQTPSKAQQIIPYHGLFWLLHFYYITPVGAQFMMRDFLPIQYQVDSFMSFKLKQTPQFRSGVHIPDWVISLIRELIFKLRCK
jgi:GR25 family glycosyltransferase involved in LPS biosynthesis